MCNGKCQGRCGGANACGQINAAGAAVAAPLAASETSTLPQPLAGVTLPPEVAQIMTLLHAAFREGDIGLSGHRVNNGADYYQCGCCYARANTMGYADSREELFLTGFVHEPDCKVARLHGLMQEFARANPQLFGLTAEDFES